MARISNDTYIKMAEAIASHRKRSERFVGCVPYSLQFELREYKGTSKKAAKVDVLTGAIIKLVGRGVSDKKVVASILGLNLKNDLEMSMFEENLKDAKAKLELIKEEKNKLQLTPQGLLYYKRGELVQTFSSPFRIAVVPSCSYFPYLKECLDSFSEPKRGEKEVKDEDLTLPQIQFIAEVQATNVQHKQNSIELVEASFVSYRKATLNFIICFMQDVRDNHVRTIIYDEKENTIIPRMSALFDENEGLKDGLLKQCLKKGVDDDEVEIVDSGEKTEEQVQAEKEIIAEVEEKGEDYSEGESHRKTVGSIYDSMEFETELREIFESHRNQEIWLISPWIRNAAFLRYREPQIRKFLDKGGAIFIGYSQPEKYGEEMVEPMSMTFLKQLDELYDRFYFTELPKFHFKNVIEYKAKVATLYTGSFNVLSFSINKNTEHYRMEHMMLANKEAAIETRQKYLGQFAQNYVERYLNLLDSKKEGDILKAPKLNYLETCGVLEEKMQTLKKKADSKSIIINTGSVSDLNREDLLNIASRIADKPFSNDEYFMQALLSAYLYLFEDAKEKNNEKGQSLIIQQIEKLLLWGPVYQLCSINIKRGTENPQKTIVRFVINDMCFEFGEISLSSKAFRRVNAAKVFIDFKGRHIPFIKGGGLVNILYNSAKAVIKVE